MVKLSKEEINAKARAFDLVQARRAAGGGAPLGAGIIRPGQRGVAGVRLQGEQPVPADQK